MFRHAFSDLEAWWRKTARKPLLLRGARQVGKSTLVRLFAAQQGLDLVEVNLEQRPLRMRDGTLDVDILLDEIEIAAKKRVTSRSLLFIDEIQAEPRMLMALRYFYEQRPELGVIAAGSLLEIALHQAPISFPVGRVEPYNLGPMSFFEFLQAIGENALHEKLLKPPFSSAAHEAAIEQFTRFLFVGGMPEAVSRYAEERRLSAARDVHTDLLQTFIADFPKFRRQLNIARVERVFLSAAAMAGRKVIYQAYDRESRSREIRDAIALLTQARVLSPCVHAESGGLPIEASVDETIFKLYLLDVGLFGALQRIDYDMMRQEAHARFASRGVIAEHFVAQHLIDRDPRAPVRRLHYWLRDKGAQKGEVDFVVQEGQALIPMEVKAGAAGRMKSLFYYAAEKDWARARKLSLEPYHRATFTHRIGDRSISVDLETIPLYALESCLPPAS